MTSADVTPADGVYRRDNSTQWQFGLRVPKDLLPKFGWKPWAVRQSLGTSDLREANAKARTLHAEWVAKFDALRSGKPAPAPVPVNLAALRAKMLAHAEQVYLPTADRLSATMTPEKRAELAATNRWTHDYILAGLKEGFDPSEVAEGYVEAMLAKERSPAAVHEVLAFSAMLSELSAEALTDETRTFPLRVKRLGERRALALTDAPLAEAPAAVSMLKPAGTGHRIGDALAVWMKAKPRPPKTVGAFSRHASQFASMMGDPVLSSLTKLDANRFRDKLQQWAMDNRKTAATADNVLVSIKTLTNAARDQGWVETNPFERLAVKTGGRESEGREPWKQEELAVLFDDPIWTEYRLPDAAKAGADAAYWIPLIACYTGARVTEIAQLWTDDLTTTRDAEAIEFRANKDRRQALKNSSSWRAVPMHSELVRLGLPDYVVSLPEGPLFPKLKTAGKNGAGGQFGHWFGDFKRGKGFESRQKTLHSFRHLVASELRLNGATDALADSITGHAGEGVARKIYAATIRRKAEPLRSVIELLRFEPLLQLPKLVR